MYIYWKLMQIDVLMGYIKIVCFYGEYIAQ